MLAQLAQAVRERRLSAVELVRESIDRVERLDPALNAVTALWPEEALAGAEGRAQRRAPPRACRSWSRTTPTWPGRSRTSARGRCSIARRPSGARSPWSG